MARPTKLTPAVQQAIVKAVAEGNYPEVAAQAAGIEPRTFYRWMSQGRRARSGAFRQFCQAIKKAEADAEQKNVAVVQKASKKTWQAACWLLERKQAVRWGRKETRELAALIATVRQLEKTVRAHATQAGDPPAATIPVGPGRADARPGASAG